MTEQVKELSAEDKLTISVSKLFDAFVRVIDAAVKHIDLELEKSKQNVGAETKREEEEHVWKKEQHEQKMEHLRNEERRDQEEHDQLLKHRKEDHEENLKR